MIINALSGLPLPVYGYGKQVRDWVYVDDHANALIKVATSAPIGEHYNIGGNNEKENIEVVLVFAKFLMNLLQKNKKIVNHKNLIKFVEDKGHDVRYAIDSNKLDNLGWELLKLWKLEFIKL